MAPSLGRSSAYIVTDAFDIKPDTGAERGVVVVLDCRVHEDPKVLVGLRSRIILPDGTSAQISIDDAKDHLKATSLFFRDRSVNDVPKGAQVELDNFQRTE